MFHPDTWTFEPIARVSAPPRHHCSIEVKLTSFSQPFFGALGCTSAIVFTCFGAAYGTAKAGVGVCGMAVLRPDLIVKSTLTSMLACTRCKIDELTETSTDIVPIVMAGIIGIYG